MISDQREIRRMRRILEHAEATGNVGKTCRYPGIGRASFYRWRHVYQAQGEAGLTNKRSAPHNHPNKTAAGGRDGEGRTYVSQSRRAAGVIGDQLPVGMGAALEADADAVQGRAEGQLQQLEL